MSERRGISKIRTCALESPGYFIKDARTTIQCLSSRNYELALKTIATVCLYVNDDKFMESLFNNGLYPILIQLLTHADECILRFTIKILAHCLSSEKYLQQLEFREIFSSTTLVMKLFLENNDDTLVENILQVLVHLARNNPHILSSIVSVRFVKKIFETLNSRKNQNIYKNSLKLLQYSINTAFMKEELHKIKNFSSKPLLNVFKYRADDITELALDIVRKIVLWKNEDLLVLLTKENALGVMTRMLMNNSKYQAEALEILKVCLANSRCAIRFSTTLEFNQFCHWFKTCPHDYIEPAIAILTLLARFREIREYLFHLSVEDMLLPLLNLTSEPVIYNICEMVSNLINHKDCSQKLMHPSLIKTLLRMLNNEKIALIPHRELILRTLHDFISHSTRGMFKYLKEYKGFVTIRTLFCNRKDDMSPESFEMLLNIVHLATDTSYMRHVSKPEVYKTLLDLYKNKQHMLPVLDIIITQIPYKHFRNYFLKSNGPEIVASGLKNFGSPEVFRQMIAVINYSVMYKKAAFMFLSTGVLAVLNNLDDKLKEEYPMIDDICDKLYNLCLSLKFFDKGRIEIHDIMTDKFCLLHQDWPTQSNTNVEFDGASNPIYVVEYAYARKSLTYLQSPTFKKIYRTLHNITSTTSITNCKLMDVNVTLQHARSLGFIAKDYWLPPKYEYLVQDTHLNQYIKDLQDALLYSEDAIICFKAKVKYVAIYVNKQMSSFSGATSPIIQRSFYEKHLNELKRKFNSNFIPIGFVKMGYTCEKALLFKVLADNLHIPATLCKGENGIYWNEVAVLPTDQKQSSPPTELKYYIIDLVESIGNFMEIGSADAVRYCKQE